MIDLERAKSLRPGELVHFEGDGVCRQIVGPRGGVTKHVVVAKVIGRPRTWKRSPERVEVPIKHGLYQFGTLSERNLQFFHLAEDCTLLRRPTDEEKEVEPTA